MGSAFEPRNLDNEGHSPLPSPIHGADEPALLALLDVAAEPRLVGPELDLAHDFAVQQHAPATRKAYKSDFALFAHLVLRPGPFRLSCGS